jgi:hypothetical protein
MKTKHGFLFGIAVLLVAAMFTLTLAGCDNGSTDPDDPGNGNGGDKTGPTATISLKNTGTNTFTLTLTGATWMADGDGSLKTRNYAEIGSALITINPIPSRCLDHLLTNPVTLGYEGIIKTVTRTSDTVLTVEVTKNENVSNNTGTATFKLLDDTQWAEATTIASGGTTGAVFLNYMTNEGVQDASNKYLGTLTVAAGSDTTVPITIN